MNIHDDWDCLKNKPRVKDFNSVKSKFNLVLPILNDITGTTGQHNLYQRVLGLDLACVLCYDVSMYRCCPGFSILIHRMRKVLIPALPQYNVVKVNAKGMTFNKTVYQC